eukprot:TRINITY_DN2507_c0_g1_i3.p1 TRINITY_DN2507_c0_g1~~TRINITY_DN2507_c0_g1_i3.p1  ORF type:complete len:197 (-),score=32.64 TRINITY_DN2507_c0_g1_i3:259-849(-)
MAKAWAFVPLPEFLHTQLHQLVSLIPNRDWLTDHRGSPNPQASYEHHITFLRNIDPILDNETLLSQLVASQPALELALDYSYFHRVERLQQDVWALGFALMDTKAEEESSEFRKFRERCASSLSGEAQIPYAGPGHISVCYVDGRYKDQAAEVLCEAARQMHGTRFWVREVCLKYGGHGKKNVRVVTLPMLANQDN